MLRQPKSKQQVQGQTQPSQYEAEGILLSRGTKVGLQTATNTCCSRLPIAGAVSGQYNVNKPSSCWLAV